MYESKSLKSDEGIKKVSKALQRKVQAGKHFDKASNSFAVGGAVQLKKLYGEQGLVSAKPIQREVLPEEEEEPLQMKAANETGMPDQLKSGMESLSGLDMSDVRVHYNSDKPAGVGALAYTQGTDIHVAPGQERHLAHEAWHVIQQAQGRVQPTTQLKDVAVNDDPGLEHEADVMGERALGE